MKFLIQYNMMNEDSLQKVKSAVDKHNIPHEYVGIIPFSREITSNEPLEGTEYLMYGSTLMTNLTSEDGLKWRGNYHDPETFRAEVWNAKRSDMLNAGDVTMTIENAIKFLEQQDPKSLWFTRPCEDLKQYSGQVIEAGECIAWFHDACECASSGSYKLEFDTMVVIAEPRNIKAEWRWFIVDGKIISGSMYRLNGVLDKRKELDVDVINEARMFANMWLPHRNCVMDLALVDDQLKVIEFNTINSSGFYDHDVERIIAALWEDFVRNKPC